MRDEFSDELGDVPNAGDGDSSHAAGDAAGGAAGDPFATADDSDAAGRDRPAHRSRSAASARRKPTQRRGVKRGDSGTSGSDSGDGNRGDGAASSAGTGAGAGSGNGDGGRTAADSDATGTSEAQRASAFDFRIKPPRNVAYSELGKDKKRGAERFDVEVLKLGIDFVFSAPRFVLPEGTADHWPLSDPESSELAKRLQVLLAALPSAKKTRLMKLFERYGPWAMFAVSAGLITYPRVAMTRALIAQQRANNATQPAPSDARDQRTGQRNPDIGASQHAPGGGQNGSPNGASGNGRARFAPLDANATDF